MAITPELALPTSPRPSFWLPWGVAVLLAALGCRLLWVLVFQGEVGGDAIRYLWIGEHVRRGDWHLLPQLFSSPLLPLSIGLLSHLTGDLAMAATWLGVLMNTLAVGLAMAVIRQLWPARPFLAWFTGLGLAMNPVWGRLAPFALTENLFYPIVMGFFWVLGRCWQRPTWPNGLALGLGWGLLYLSREIGLYFGALGFLGWLAGVWWQNRRPDWGAVARVAVPALSVLAVILITWMSWLYTSLGIISLGEGHRFYSTYSEQFDRRAEGTYPGYTHGETAFFRLRPYELMEYTRFPRPADPRYPKGGAGRMFADPVRLAGMVLDNLGWSLKEFQRVTIIGFLLLFLYFPWQWLRGRLSLPPEALWLYLINWSILGFTFLGPVREARLIGWFFPWLYLSLGAAVSWLWLHLPARLPRKHQQRGGQALLIGLVGFHLLFPQYFKEIPRRWQVRQEPHIHQLAAAYIVGNFGPDAIISSVEAEVAYRAGGYWIGQPNAEAQQLVEWLYLGGADFLLVHDRYGLAGGRETLWSDPDTVTRTFPELTLAASFAGVKNVAYGRQARLFRFFPDPEKLAAYRRLYPWAGTHPRQAGAAAVPAKPF